MTLDRTNNSLFGRWWWTIDRLNLFAIFLLMVIGSILVAAGSPPVAKRLGLYGFHFVHRHQIFLLLGFLVMIATSMLSATMIRRVAIIGFAATIILMILVPFIGEQTKGAHRWMNIFGFSIQPSEFMKPCFAVVIAWICAESHKKLDFPAYRLAIGLYLLVVFLLLIQPDFGMTLTVTAMWGIQLFLGGLPMIFVILLGIFGIAGIFTAYNFLPHVAQRINNFLDPSEGDNYQINHSLEAFRNGGLLGRGPGEGEIKQILPDSHTDFIFAVAGEEFGAIVCLIILALFAFIVLRGLFRVWQDNDIFGMLAVAGVLAQFGIQAIVNMGVAVNLLPAKGMTLPFLSYGGSSVIALAFAMGIMLSLTRRRYGRK